MVAESFVSVFERIFDVVVYGAGYVGYAAAHALKRQGKSVLLVDTQGDLLWESGRCFVPVTGDGAALNDPAFRALLDDLRSRHGYDGRLIDGAMAEVSATCLLKESGIHVLYYVCPVMTECHDGLIDSLIVATKSGPRRIAARQFIDASENGLLAKLAGKTLTSRHPESSHLYMYLISNSWGDDARGEPTLWPSQKLFTCTIESGQSQFFAMESAISAMNEAEQKGKLSHASFVPYPVYRVTGHLRPVLGNLAVASPSCVGDGVETLADRYALGLSIAENMAGLPSASPAASFMAEPVPAIPAGPLRPCDVAVIGTGTGGVVAAIAAAKQGAKVLAVDSAAHPGGIFTLGGIYSYYFGVPGGMQDQFDDEVRALMKKYGNVLAGHTYNPYARLMIYAKHFSDHNIRFLAGSMLCSLEAKDGTVGAAIFATPYGPLRCVAPVFVDGTGDGDLCAMAGARYTLGRDADGVIHAYSQPTGSVQLNNQDVHVGSRNLDSGWCDPTDSEDLTRARLISITHYQKDHPADGNRVTVVSPLLGLRQGRLIKTDHVITLDDMIAARHCDDVIGYAGTNFDTHTPDYPLESDDAIFWVCLARAWYTGYVTPMPYRCLLPVGLRNVIIASRCLGVTQDASYGLRMMRCMQRIGEAAGYAAASMISGKLNDARQVPIADIQKKLKATGALLDDLSTVGSGWFKSFCDELASRKPGAALSEDPRVIGALKNLQDGKPDPYFWLLMKNQGLFESQVMRILRTGSGDTRWYAAGIAAMWGKPEAEDVLIDSIKTHAWGFERRNDNTVPRQQFDPLVAVRFMQNWLTAVCLLRPCGTDRCLPALKELMACHKPTLLTAEAVLLTLSRLLNSGRISDKVTVRDILLNIQPDEISARFVTPVHTVTGLADIALRGWDGPEPAKCQGNLVWPWCNTGEDHTWQLILMMAKLSRQLGIDLPAQVAAYRHSPQAIIRKAFAELTRQSVSACI